MTGPLAEALGGLFVRFTRNGRAPLWIRVCARWEYRCHDVYGADQ